jgi:hypothetical protein
MKKGILLAVVLVLGVAALAQDSTKFEAAIDYSYGRFNPSHAYISNSFSLNGGGGSIAYNFADYFAIKADFEGYGSATRSFSIPAGSQICPSGCSGNVQANLFTYQFGPQLGLREGKVQPFVHLLLGGAHSNLGANLYRAAGSTGKRPSDDAFALSFGAGVDIVVNHAGTIAFRPCEFDYLWTNFNLNSHQSGQSNFQYKAGMVFKF